MRNASIIVGSGFLVLALGWYFLSMRAEESVPQQEQVATTSLKDVQGAATGGENLVTFTCAEGKTITAVFERDVAALTLSDGRQLRLREAPTASSARYVSNDGSIEFRGKGLEGQLWEEGAVVYSRCIVENR